MRPEAAPRVKPSYADRLETVDENSSARARAFNPLYSEREDSATGVAAGALAAVLSAGQTLPVDYVLEQGNVLEKNCKIYVSVEPDGIKVGGIVTAT